MTVTDARRDDAVPGGIGDTQTLTCVFAVCENGGDAAAADWAGHPEAAAPYLLALGGEDGAGDGPPLWALAQDVPAARFSEEALRLRFADQADLELCARAHHAAVNAAAAVGPIVPLPLATLFKDRARARVALSERAGQFREVLDRVRGRAEWAVKVYAAPAGTSPAAPTPAPSRAGGSRAAVTATPDAGRAYLERVRSRQRERETKQETALSDAARVDEALCALADDVVRRRPHGPEITGRDRTQILNAAYLIDQARTGELHAAVAALTEDPSTAGRIDVSGPWVPYSFSGSERE